VPVLGGPGDEASRPDWPIADSPDRHTLIEDATG
jgi:hypothetical protein